MAEIELVERNSTSPQKLIDESNSEEKTILKEKSHVRPLVFTLFLLFIILSLAISILYRNSTSKAYIHDATKPTLEQSDKAQKLEEKIINKYETPNKLEGILDYLLYPYHSDIIRNMDDYEFIRDSLGKISLQMVFSSNIHGDYAMDLHSRANLHHILVLIETENGNRFGGYTSDNFTPQTFGLTSTSIELFKRDNSAFLFNLDAKKIFNIKPNDAIKALDCDDYFTLCFGEGDLVLKDKFLSSGGVSNFPEYYGDENTKENELTNGEKEFNIKSFEAYNVLFFAEFGDENNKMGVFKNFVK
jgi:hypothetical protein